MPELSPSKQTVLVIGYVWPEPNSSAAGSHMLSLLRLFKKQGWQVTFASPAQTSDHMHDLATEDIKSCAIELNSSTFDDFVSTLNPTIVMFDRFMMEEQFGWRVQKKCPDALRILDTEDLQSLRDARHRAHKQHRKLLPNDLNSDLAKREIAAIYRSDLSLIISSYEATLLKEHFGVASELLYHLPFMLDIGKLATQKKAFADRNNFVVIGNFRHAPNWDSVLYLQEIWPLIQQQMVKKQLPKAELHIYGSYPPKKATDLNNPKTGFLIKGWTEDALKVIGNAKVLLAPLRFGAGIKGKLLDAMQTGTPSVTTNIGAEGMTTTQSWPGLIANNITEIADAAVALYTNEEQWQKASESAESLLMNVYDSEPLGAELIKQIGILQENLEGHRLNNFTGAMLNHHTMKSTQYMSQWIEAKNKR